MEHFVAKDRNSAVCTFCSYEGSKTVEHASLPRPVERFLFQIVDKSDGQVKTLVVGKSVAQQIFGLLTQPRPKQRRNWFMRILEWLRIVKPLPEVDPEFNFEISCRMEPITGTVARYPRYEVRAV